MASTASLRAGNAREGSSPSPRPVAEGASPHPNRAGRPPSPAPTPSGSGAGGGGGGGCFIATAAFGSYHAPEVILLQKFRDRILMASEPGRLFVAFYYRVSPPIADFIGRDDSLRRAARLSLKPLIFSIQHRLGMYLGVLTLLMGMTLGLYVQQRRLLREVRGIQWRA